MQTSIKLEKLHPTKKRDLTHMNDKERDEHIQRQMHKRKHHKTKRGQRPEWEGSY